MNAFDPYYTWLGIPPEDQPADHYRLLGVKRFESNLDVISHASDKQMMHLRSFQTGQYAQASQHLLNELATVRVSLLNPEKKAAYDQQLRSRLAPAQPIQKLPTAVVLSSPQPQPVEEALPEFGNAAPSHSRGKPVKHTRPAKAQPPVLLYAMGGVAVLVVGVLVVLLMRKPATVPTVTQGTGHPTRKEPTRIRQEKLVPVAPPLPTLDETISPALLVPKSDPDEEPTPTPIPLADTPASDPATLPTVDPMETVVEEPMPMENTPTPLEPAKEEPATPPSDETKVEPAKEIAPTEAVVSTPAAVPAEVKAEVVQKMEVPSAEEIKQAETLVAEIFASDIAAAKNVQQRGDLAGKLIQNADETVGPDASRYVLLTKASELAAQAGDGRLINSACDNLAEHYVVDVFKLKGRAYSEASKINLEQQDNGALCEQVLVLSDEAAVEERFDMAVPLMKVAQTFARKVKDKDLFKRISIQTDKLEALQNDFLAADKAAKILADNPGDEAASLAYGKYLALGRHHWERALPLLAKGNEAQLKAAAVADLARPATADAQAAVGDLWYALAAKDKNLAGFHARAHYWYDIALPRLTGLTKTRAEKRLEETEAYASALAGQPAGVVFMGPITAKLRQTIPAHARDLSALVFSPNSRMLVSGSYDRSIKLWDVATGEVGQTLNCTSGVQSLAFMPDGKTLISGSNDYKGLFWALPSGQIQQTIKDCSYVALTGDGKTLVVHNPLQGTNTLWDAASVQQIVALEKASPCRPPRISQNGKVLVAYNGEFIFVWNVLTGRVVHKIAAETRTIAISPDGRLLVSADNRGQLFIWNLATGVQLHTMEGDNNYVSVIAFSPDGATFVTGGSEELIRFWNPQTGERRVDVPEEDGYVSAIAFSPNGKMMATGSWNSKLKLWDVEKLAPTNATAPK